MKKSLYYLFYNIDVTPKTVTAYGGGIARTGNICGAINVAIMGVAQKYGRESPRQTFVKTQRKIFQFLNQIVDQYGSIHCSQLTKTQLSTLDGIRKFRDQNLKENLCTPLIIFSENCYIHGFSTVPTLNIKITQSFVHDSFFHFSGRHGN